MKDANEPTDNYNDAIAIIGMACRFPLASDTETYWEELCKGTNATKFFKDSELINAGIEPTVLASNNYVKAASKLEGIEEFDNKFFDLTPREAEILDPQQRVLLECAYQALEQAGYAAKAEQYDTGVFVGSSASSYIYENLLTHPDIIESMGVMNVSIANDKDFVATQLAYKLNLTGPAVNINTACSTSLVAVHQAINSLLNYECDMALAGGASVKANQTQGYQYLEGGILSPDGYCRPFSDDAQGTIDGNGGAIICLKRLEDALSDGDKIEAIIKGSALNNDGSDKIGITAPSVKGQARVIREALAVAEIESSEVSYIEAHGTGTRLGDPIEISALKEAFQSGAANGNAKNCAIGSVKSNMGHLDSAAGIAGLIKAALIVREGVIPPTINFSKENSEIDFTSSPFFVADHLQKWPSENSKRVAGVSSFGIGGTNAHIIIEQPPQLELSKPSQSSEILCISAKSQESLLQGINNLSAYLTKCIDSDIQEPSIGDVCYTLSNRPDYPYRYSTPVESVKQAVEKLNLAARSIDLNSIEKANPIKPEFAYIFSDYQAPSENLKWSLYSNEKHYQNNFDKIITTFKKVHGTDTLENINQNLKAQLELFAFQYSIASLYQSLGCKTDYMYGQGIGIIVIGLLSDAITPEKAIESLIASCENTIAKETVYKELNSLLSNIDNCFTFHASNQEFNNGSLTFDALLSQLDGYNHLVYTIDILGTVSRDNIKLTNTYKVIGEDSVDSWLQIFADIWAKGAQKNFLIDKVNNQEYRKIFLPSYSFAKEKYWISPNKSSLSPQEVSTAGTNQAGLFKYDWRALISSTDTAAENVKRLIVSDSYGFCEQAFNEVGKADDIWVNVNEDYAKKSNHSYHLDPKRPEQYDTLFESILESKTELDVIEYCLTIDYSRSNGHAIDEIKHIQWSIIEFIKAVKKLKTSQAYMPILRFYFESGFQVTGEESTSLVARTLISMLLVITQEMPDTQLQIIDIANIKDSKHILESIDYINSCTTPSAVYALRGKKVWFRDFVSVPTHDSANSRLSVDGTIVYTGGFGLTATPALKHLALECKNLIILGRRKEEELSSDASQQLMRLQAINSGVKYLSTDVSDYDMLQDTLTFISNSFGKISTLIHGAGQMHRENLCGFDAAEIGHIEIQHNAKINGSSNIIKALEHIEIENLVMMSSLSASIGGLGMFAYSSVNGYMDALAERAELDSSITTKIYSINWDGLGDSSKQGADSNLISPEEMINNIFVLLSSKKPGHWLYGHGDLNARWLKSIKKTSLLTDKTSAKEQKTVIADSDIEREVISIFEELVGVTNLQSQDNFFEIGGDSVTATQLCMLLENKFDLSISIEDVFNMPEVSHLSSHIKDLRSKQSSESDELEKLLEHIETMDPIEAEKLLSENV